MQQESRGRVAAYVMIVVVRAPLPDQMLACSWLGYICVTFWVGEGATLFLINLFHSNYYLSEIWNRYTRQHAETEEGVVSISCTWCRRIHDADCSGTSSPGNDKDDETSKRIPMILRR